MNYIPIEIPKRQRTCSQKGELLQPGMEYHSVLETTPQGWLRHDYCQQCWQERSTKEAHTNWKGKVPAKTVLEKKVDRLSQALDALKDNLTEKNLEEAYVLALFLHRKKWLALRGEKKKGDMTYLLYEIDATEEILAVPKLPLNSMNIAELQDKIAKKLNA